MADAMESRVNTSEQLRTELEALWAAGATDVILYPASAGLEQIDLLAEALGETGFPPSA